MQIIAHGVDIVVCARIARIWQDHGDRFLERLYTPAERAYCLECRTPLPRLAGRFAAKEAVLKVLGTGLRGGLEWTDIETLPDGLGKPVVTLHGAAGRAAAALGITGVLMSISHAGDYAVASAIGIRA
jgi:holo-[acyl-carrier protein] synthase